MQVSLEAELASIIVAMPPFLLFKITHKRKRAGRKLVFFKLVTLCSSTSSRFHVSFDKADISTQGGNKQEGRF